MASSVLVELQATTSEFMAKMGAARGEVAKLGTEGSGNMAKFQAVAGAAFLATGAAVVGVGALAVDLAVKFDASVAKIQGSAQITQKAAQGIGDAFLHTAGDSTYSGKQMADAFGPVAGVVQTLAGHTLTAADAMKVMSASTELAEATGQPLATTTADLSAVMQAYGLNLNQASDASNILYNTSRLTGVPLDTLTTTVDKLHMKLGIAAPDLADTGGLMEDLATHGVSGSRGVMVASTAMSTLLGGTKPVTAELKTLGVNIFDSSGKFIGMQAALAQLSPKLAGMTDQQRLLAESTLFGASSGIAMNSTILAGAPAFAKATAAVSAHDAVQKAAEASTATLEGQIKKLKAGAEDYATLLGEKLIPIITTVVTTLDKHKTTVEALGVVIGALVVGLAAYYAVTKTIELATKAWTAAQAALNLVMDANPIMLVVIGIAALVVAFVEVYQHCKTLRDAFADAWSFIKTAFDDGLAFIKAHMDLIGAALLLLLGPIGLIIGAAILLWQNWSAIWGEIKSLTVDTFNFLKGIFDDVIAFIEAHWKVFAEGLATVLLGPLGLIIVYVATHFDQVKQLFSDIEGAISGAWSATWNGIKSVVSTVVDAVVDTVGKIKTLGTDVITREVQGFKSVWDSAWNGARATVQGVWSVLSGIFNDIKAGVRDVTDAIDKVGAAVKSLPGGGVVGKVLGKLATGGPAAANTPYLIGEEGPEIFVPDQAGTVLPNSVFAGTGGGTLLTSRTSGGLTSGGGDVSLSIPLVVDGKTIATAVVPSVRTLLLQKKNQTGVLGLA